MDQDGKHCEGQGASFHSIVVHWQDGHRDYIHPGKDPATGTKARVLLMVAVQDELGQLDYDRGFVLPHANVSTCGEMISRLYRIYPGLRKAVADAEEREARKIKVPGSMANN